MDPFLHREAALHGVTPDQLRGAAWAHPVAGVSIESSHTGELNLTCRAIALALPPDAVFTHLTSAVLRRWWLPYLPECPLVACSDSDAPHRERRGVYVRRCGIPPSHRTDLEGVPVASAEWTILELAEHLSLIDLVAAIDSAVHRGHTTLEELRQSIIPGRRGVRVLRRALELCDGRSESRWESILRLVYVLAGIPVEPQHELRAEDGSFIARGDLHVSGTHLISEYDGDHHRDRQRHHRDLRREKSISRAGFVRFGYAAPEILHAPHLIIGDAERALGWASDPRRLRTWRAEFELSSLSPDGYRALQGRIRRFSRPSAPRRDVNRRTSGANSGSGAA